MCQAAMRWSAVRLDSLVIASSFITALLVISLKDELSPAFAGLAMAYATQMTGVFQYTVRLMSETEVRFISVERISYYIRVSYLFACNIIIFPIRVDNYICSFVRAINGDNRYLNLYNLYFFSLDFTARRCE